MPNSRRTTLLPKKGIIVDASVVDTQLRPNGNSKHKVTENRSQEEITAAKKEYAESVDKDGT